MEPKPVAEQLAALPEPCAHQHHDQCTKDCPCFGRPDGEPVDFSTRPPFTGTGLPRGGH